MEVHSTYLKKKIMLHREFINHCCVFKAILMDFSLYLFSISSQSAQFFLNQRVKICVFPPDCLGINQHLALLGPETALKS